VEPASTLPLQINCPHFNMTNLFNLNTILKPSPHKKLPQLMTPLVSYDETGYQHTDFNNSKENSNKRQRYHDTLIAKQQNTAVHI
jgi:hypothetical protein